MRRGTSLIEMVATIPVLLAVISVFSSVFYAALGDVPRLQQVAHTHSVLSHMLNRLQQDIDAAESLPESALGNNAGEKLLLIQLPETTISYEIMDGEILRQELASARNRQLQQSYNWPVPGAKVSFHRWHSPGGTWAVEVRQAVRYSSQGISEDKLANSHVFYLACIPGYREKQ